MLPIRILVRLPPGGSDRLIPLVESLEREGHLVEIGDAASPSEGYDAVLSPPEAERELLDEAEAAHIAQILARHGGNRRRTALSLGIARSTLLAKIRRYGL